MATGGGPHPPLPSTLEGEIPSFQGWPGKQLAHISSSRGERPRLGAQGRGVTSKALMR